MKVVLAPDSFKESLTAAEAAAAMQSGFQNVWSDAEFRIVPMADGGEGTVAAIAEAAGLHLCECLVSGPMGDPMRASYGASADGRLAVVEMAAASGLALVPVEDRDPLRATTLGTGELMRAAIAEGAQRCLIALGGSATVDGGAGILMALGAKLLDGSGAPVAAGGASLATLEHIELDAVFKLLGSCQLEAACDVDNPLLGTSGAAAIFGPQKGADAQGVETLERALENFARVVRKDIGVDLASIAGGGAAGGAGAMLIGCLGAKARSGAQMVAEICRLEDFIRTADLVVTGEGKLDSQTARGKAVSVVTTLARQHGKPVLVMAGAVSASSDDLRSMGVTAAFSISRGVRTRAEAMASTRADLQYACESLARFWDAAKGKM